MQKKQPTAGTAPGARRQAHGDAARAAQSRQCPYGRGVLPSAASADYRRQDVPHHHHRP